MAERPEVVDHYGAHYREFAADVYAEVRRAAFGEDIGQNSWLTVDELERFVSRLELRPETRLLDVACGSGGPSLRIARLTGCQVVGVELYDEAGAEGTRLAHEAGLERRVSFLQADASETLPFEDRSFDAILCIDSINHLPDQRRSGACPTFAIPRPDGCSPGAVMPQSARRQQPVRDVGDTVAELDGRDRA